MITEEECNAPTLADICGDTEADELRARIAALEAEHDAANTRAEVAERQYNEIKYCFDVFGGIVREHAPRDSWTYEAAANWLKRLIQRTVELEAENAALKDAAEAYYIELQDAVKRTAEIEALKAELAKTEVAIRQCDRVVTAAYDERDAAEARAAAAEEKMKRAEKVFEETSQLMLKDWQSRRDYLFDTEERAAKAEARVAALRGAEEGE